MYQPPHFREDRLAVQHDLVRAHPLGLLVTMGTDGLVADHLPFHLDPDGAPLGILRAHMARANPQAAALGAAEECLVVFQGPAAYVSPSWYPSKRETEKVVPTWNYAVVHAWGRPRVIDDPLWLRRQLDLVTGAQESRRAAPWSVDDAPADFIAAQMRGILGLEIVISRIEGKWKVSQNRPEADRAGVRDGLLAERGADDPMARLVAERGGLS